MGVAQFNMNSVKTIGGAFLSNKTNRWPACFIDMVGDTMSTTRLVMVDSDGNILDMGTTDRYSEHPDWL